MLWRPWENLLEKLKCANQARMKGFLSLFDVDLNHHKDTRKLWFVVPKYLKTGKNIVWKCGLSGNICLLGSTNPDIIFRVHSPTTTYQLYGRMRHEQTLRRSFDKLAHMRMCCFRTRPQLEIPRSSASTEGASGEKCMFWGKLVSKTDKNPWFYDCLTPSYGFQVAIRVPKSGIPTLLRNEYGVLVLVCAPTLQKLSLLFSGMRCFAL